MNRYVGNLEPMPGAAARRPCLAPLDGVACFRNRVAAAFIAYQGRA